MPAFINTLELLLFLAYGVILLSDVFCDGWYRRTGIEFLVLLLAGILLHLSTGFPVPDNRIAFGGASPAGALVVIFAGSVLGMFARYFFYLRTEFSWRAFLKPLCVSPILLLPILGLLQEGETYELLELLSLGFLAFQNGFFWRVIFERAKANA